MTQYKVITVWPKDWKVNQERSQGKKVPGNGENVYKNGIFKNESSKTWLEQELKRWFE